MSLSRIALVLAATLGLATPALADPAVGLGLSITFGGGRTETGIGLRVFSDDEKESAVGSIGLDYVFGSRRVRPTVGAAYLGTDVYLGADLGYNFATGRLDPGLSIGGTGTADADETPDDVIVDE